MRQIIIGKMEAHVRFEKKVQGMALVELPLGGDCDWLSRKVSATKVADHLVVVTISNVNTELCKQPRVIMLETKNPKGIQEAEKPEDASTRPGSGRREHTASAHNLNCQRHQLTALLIPHEQCYWLWQPLSDIFAIN
jgi:hypothetical protein